MKLWNTNNTPYASYTTLTLHSDFRSDFSSYMMSHIQYTYTYKVIATYIKHATTLQANNMCVTCECALLFTIDKLMSGSSLEGKALLRSHTL